jgi:U3 small nucleolar RNA-associated protein 19
MKIESNLSSSAQTAQEIKTLLQQLRKSSRHRKKQLGGSSGNVGGRINDGRDRDDAQQLDGLRKIFSRLIELGEFDFESGGGGDEGGNGVSSQWKAWLTTHHDDFISHLLEGIVDGKTTALRTYCGVLASSPVNISGLSRDQTTDGNSPDEKGGKGAVGMISERLLNKLLEAVVKSRQCFIHGTAVPSGRSSTPAARKDETGDEPVSSDEQLQLVSEEPILTLLESEFIRPHRDVQYFVYKGLHQIVLDLLAGLERVRKNANADAVKKDSGKNNGEAADVIIAKAETNVGVVAENICRLLLMMDYVPKRRADDLNVENGAEYLFPPPVLTASDDVVIGSDGGLREEEGFDDDDDNSSDEEEGNERSASKKRRKEGLHGNPAKRSKKTKLIAWQQSYKHRHAHQEAWLSVLRLPNIPSRTQRRVLQHLSTYVLSNDICPSPLRFAEYFTTSFKDGVSNGNNSLAAILSLHGLFILMLDHQLEYPQFYNSLYQLLHPRILYTKHRTRFLRLLSKSLSSNSMLPAYVVASFCKRLCRLALSGPPSGGLFVLALVSNLLRKHGECACLIHRRGKDEDGGLIEDVFAEDVNDLIKTRGERCENL